MSSHFKWNGVLFVITQTTLHCSLIGSANSRLKGSLQSVIFQTVIPAKTEQGRYCLSHLAVGRMHTLNSWILGKQCLPHYLPALADPFDGMARIHIVYASIMGCVNTECPHSGRYFHGPHRVHWKLNQLGASGCQYQVGEWLCDWLYSAVFVLINVFPQQKDTVPQGQ